MNEVVRRGSPEEWLAVPTMRTFAVFLIASVFFAPSVAGAGSPGVTPDGVRPAGDTIIVLDASGSMNERIRGETKMAIAHRAVRELIESLPATTRIGLVAYSHRSNRCDDIELLIPPGPLGPAEIRYVNGYDNRVLARVDLAIVAP